jgi:hypothetical protein
LVLPLQNLYRRLNQTFRKNGFVEAVGSLCEPHYADLEKGGWPGINPVVYGKMMMVGFFEDLLSQRTSTSRCDDSRAIRESWLSEWIGPSS